MVPDMANATSRACNVAMLKFAVNACACLQFFTNAAAALPAELGPDQRTSLVKQLPAVEESHKRSWQPISRFQRAWARRVAAAQQRQQQA